MLQVCFVADTHPNYGGNISASNRDMMLQNRKVAICTCFQGLYILMSILNSFYRLLLAEGESLSTQHTYVKHWLLCELLVAIGSHTML